MSNNYSILLCNDGKNKSCIETKISNEDINFIKSLNVNWYLWHGEKEKKGKKKKCTGGYICGTKNYQTLYLHSLIMNRIEEKPNEKLSVDHINWNKLDNRRENLRWATQSEQNSNRGKMKRKNGARSLPEGITQDMMRKYVVYYNECYNKETNAYREFFKVEKHPKLDKIWISSKSVKIDIKEKLKSANKIVDDLEKDVYPTKENKITPKYVTIKNIRGNDTLIFDKKDNNGRYNLRMKLKENYNLNEELEVFIKEIENKYSIEL